MPDEQDRAEALDDEKGSFPADDGAEADIMDQAIDADSDRYPEGTAAIDADEAGDDLTGVLAEPQRGDDPFHTEAPPPEVSAMHIAPEEHES